METLRRSYDIDGCLVEMIFDEKRCRFIVSSRWAHLCKIPLRGLRAHAKRLAHERASSVFEVVCLNGATREVAKEATRIAMGLHVGQFQSSAYMEREVIRRFNVVTQPKDQP